MFLKILAGKLPGCPPGCGTDYHVWGYEDRYLAP